EQLSLEPRQFCQINCPPQPPREETRYLDAENVGNCAAMTDARELTEGREGEGRLLPPANRRDDIFGTARRFPDGVLCGGRMRFSGLRVRNRRAVPDGPQSRK